MDLLVGIFYLLVFLVQLVLLVTAARKPEKKLWSALFRLEILSVLGALGLMFLFDALPGGGPMPGLTWFAEFFYSLFAAAGYGLMLLISFLVWAIRTRKQ